MRSGKATRSGASPSTIKRARKKHGCWYMPAIMRSLASHAITCVTCDHMRHMRHIRSLASHPITCSWPWPVRICSSTETAPKRRAGLTLVRACVLPVRITWAQNAAALGLRCCRRRCRRRCCPGRRTAARTRQYTSRGSPRTRQYSSRGRQRARGSVPLRAAGQHRGGDAAVAGLRGRREWYACRVDVLCVVLVCVARALETCGVSCRPSHTRPRTEPTPTPSALIRCVPQAPEGSSRRTSSCGCVIVRNSV